MASPTESTQLTSGPVIPSKDVVVTPKAYSKESEQLVKQSWEILRKDAQANAVAFFGRVFEIAPAAKALFPFMQDASVPFEQNPKVRSHALQVFSLTGNAASQLGEKGAYEIMEPQLKKLAAKHVSSGVADAHFEVVKEALLQTIEAGLPELWSPKLKLAWSDAYDTLATTLKNEMHAQVADVEA